MTRGGLRGRARGGIMRGGLSLRGMYKAVYSFPPMRILLTFGLQALNYVTFWYIGKRVLTGGPMRGRGSANRLAMRRGGRHRGGVPGRGGALSRGAARGGIARGQSDISFILHLKTCISPQLN